MKTLKIAALGLIAASLAGAAFAQDASGAMAPASPAMDSSQAAAPSAATTPSADAAASNTNATVQNTTVTNGPVPDTPENRAKYGAPMSHAGKKTKPAGN